MSNSTKPASKRAETKIRIVVRLLGRKSGASLEALMEATGWQRHTVRAALTGLKKKGHTIERRGEIGKSIYKIDVGSKR